jgi:chitin synthase
MVGLWLCDLYKFSNYCRVYAFLSVYLFTCSIILTVKSFSVGSVANSNWHALTYSPSQSIDFGNAKTAGERLDVLLSGTNGTLMAALSATFGIYIIASFLYRDPYHIFTSLVSLYY